MALGHRRAGWPGLLAGGASFIGPAAAITCTLAWTARRAGLVVFLVAVACAAAASAASGETPLMASSPPVAVPSLLAVGLFFLRTGAVLYGGGYVLVALLQPLVDSHGWLSQAQLVDAVAAGQVTPGPVLTTATFVGYLPSGFGGALVATVAIFLPAFALVGGLGHLAPRLRAWAPTRGFLYGVNAAAVALMLVVTITLARSVIVDLPAILIVALTVAAAVRGVSGGWIVLGGVAAGALMRIAGL